MSNRGTEITGRVEAAAQQGIAEAWGEIDATAAKDEARKYGRGLAEHLLLRGVEVVPDPNDLLRDQRADLYAAHNWAAAHRCRGVTARRFP